MAIIAKSEATDAKVNVKNFALEAKARQLILTV